MAKPNDYPAEVKIEEVEEDGYGEDSEENIRRSVILDDLVYKEVDLADKLRNPPEPEEEPILTDKKTMINRIIKSMLNDDFTIDDLELHHFQEVSKFYDCSESSVKKEFERRYEIQIRRNAILDNLVNKEVDLAYNLYDYPEPEEEPKWTEITTMVDRIIQNLLNDNFTIDDLKAQHFQEVSEFYDCSKSLVKNMFERRNERSAQHCLNRLVSDVIEMAKADRSIFSSKELVIGQIVEDMSKTTYNYLIWDLKECHFKKVADLFRCRIPEVKTEFENLLKNDEPGKIYEFEDYTKDNKPTRPIVKSANYRKKDSRITFQRSAILDDLVYKERGPLNDSPEQWTERNIVIVQILQNLVNDDFSINDLADHHYQKVANLYQETESRVKESFLLESEGVEKEDEKAFDLASLVSGLIKLDPSSKKTHEELIRFFVTTLEWFDFKITELSSEDYENLSNFFKLEPSYVEEEFCRMSATLKKEKQPLPSCPTSPARNQKRCHEEPAAKKRRIAAKKQRNLEN